MTWQIVQIRYEGEELVEDVWPTTYEIAAQGIAAFNPHIMFEYDAPDADYFIRELDRNYIETGKTYELTY